MPNTLSFADTRPSEQQVRIITSNEARVVKRLQASLRAGKTTKLLKDAKAALLELPHSRAIRLIQAQALLSIAQYQAAQECLEHLLQVAPGDEDAITLLAQCYIDRGHSVDALQLLAAFLQSQDSIRIRLLLADVLVSLQRNEDALTVLQDALQSGHRTGALFKLMGDCLLSLQNWQGAAQAYELGMKLAPHDASNFYERGLIARHHEGADPRPYFLQAFETDAAHQGAKLGYLYASLSNCDWDAVDKVAPLLPGPNDPEFDKHPLNPWPTLALQDNPQLLLKRQSLHQKSKLRRLRLPHPIRVAPVAANPCSKVRLGFFSSDFHTHATTFLFSGVLRHFNRDAFELHCFDFGKNDAYGQRVKAQFDHVHDLQGVPDADCVARSRAAEIDIAIDMKGETQGNRSTLFLAGLAPLQINYLGYPATMGSAAYDYIIADHVVVPKDLARDYSERIIRLPTCYLPSDDRLRATLPPTRTALGLPEEAVVLACLNQHYKISRDAFAIWMQALQEAPDTVLWLLDGTDEAKDRLRASAQKHGVDPARVHFAPHVPHQEHVTRLAQADLFLDTFFVNAHTLAADTICGAGVPLLTCAGRQFAARVGASFAHAAGLDDLIAQTPEDYATKLIALAKDPGTLRALRGHIAQQRRHAPLFSTATYTACLEQAFQSAMWRLRAGQKPASFDVTLQDIA